MLLGILVSSEKEAARGIHFVENNAEVTLWSSALCQPFDAAVIGSIGRD